MKKSLLLIAISMGITTCAVSCETSKKGSKSQRKAIIHRSPEQEKLDSLKLEKQKGKL